MRGPMKAELVAIDSLTFDPSNVRKHGEQNLATIKASLNRFGQQKPIVVDANGVVRAGNGTLMAAKALGWKEIAVVRSTLAGSEATAYAIADNRTAELAEWDDDALKQTLAALQIEDENLALATGFDAKEIDAMLAPDEVTEDEVPEPPADPITKPGDLWTLGDHRVLCGDSTKAEDVERLMSGAKADLCFTSPPYGQQRDYTKEGKEKCSDWDGLMRGVFANLPMADDGQVLVNLGLIHREGEWIPYWDGWIKWMREQGWRRFGWYVWDQGNGLPGDWSGRLAPSHEFIWHFNRQAVKPQHCVPKQAHSIRDRTADAVMRMGAEKTQRATSGKASLNTHKIPDSVLRVQRQCGKIETGDYHPAVFPVAFPRAVLEAWPGTAYEPFLGSGTTLIAAEQLGRKCYGMEISPAYCDVIVKRWENLTGRKAIRG
jgi:DNA modification methylase